MLNFELKNPTKIIFGKDTIAKLSEEIPTNAKILILYGGGSIKKNGVYEQVIEALKNHSYLEFGGIPANPEYEVLMEALKIIKNENINYLLAVGGGSVIDGTKFLSAAAHYQGEDAWEILTRPIRTMEGEGMPFGTVLTLPATGSEMNSGYVISRRSTQEKRSSGGPGLFPQFSILDPNVIQSIPKHQLANGIADAYTHVLEQYMTYKTSAALQERFAESILVSLQELAPQLLENNFDYDTAANFMWCCTMALNGLIQKGVPTDWAVHAIGHELTAKYGIDHARTLAIVAPPYYTYCLESKKDKLVQYGKRVWGITEGNDTEIAQSAIQHLEKFFQSLGIDTRLSAYTDDYQNIGKETAEIFTKRNWLGLGEHKKITPEDVQKVLEMIF